MSPDTPVIHIVPIKSTDDKIVTEKIIHPDSDRKLIPGIGKVFNPGTTISKIIPLVFSSKQTMLVSRFYD